MDEEKKNNKRVKWDEEKLQETQKFRGMYQKIDEPKTPYRKNSNSDEEEEEMEEAPRSQEQIEIYQSLQKAKVNKETNRKARVDIETLNAQLKEEMEKYNVNQDEGEQMEEQQTEQQRKKRQEFKKKRAAHYNEFKNIQAARQNQWEDDSDEEE